MAHRLGMPPMLDILAEHLEELDFLWEQRERVVFAPDWTLHELAELEERAEAHLDGLRIGRDHAVRIARQHIGTEDAGAATAAALTLMAMGSQELANEVVDTAESGGEVLRTGIRIALRHSDVNLAADRLYELGIGHIPELRALAADVLTFHRLRPPPELESLLQEEAICVRRLVFAIAGRIGGLLSLRDVENTINSGDIELGRLALEAAARTGLPGLAPMCRRLGWEKGRHPAAVAFLGVVGGDEDVPILRRALVDPDLAKAALEGLGALGRVVSIPWIIEAMSRPDTAQAARAAFARMTRIDDIDQASEPSTSPPESEDDDLADHPAQPDPERASAGWERLKPRLAAARSIQAGVDTGALTLSAALTALPLRSRRDLYLSERARRPGQIPDIELEARAVVQLASSDVDQLRGNSRSSRS